MFGHGRAAHRQVARGGLLPGSFEPLHMAEKAFIADIQNADIQGVSSHPSMFCALGQGA